MSYESADEKSGCAIEVHQSPERYAAMLEMFKGGYVSEITMIVEGLVERPDYSKYWDLEDQANIAIKSICFEFPLPQSDA